VQRQFQLNRKDEFIKSFIQEAITRVVKPLHLDELTLDQVIQAEAELSDIRHSLSTPEPVPLQFPLPHLAQPERELEWREQQRAIADEWESPQTLKDDWED
jgi:hypothetical protein